MTLTPGVRLGPYTVVGAVGAGGMGEVYRARDSRLERDVAIKVLPAALTDSATARERFQREARAVAALQHPNICTIFDVGDTPDGQAFLVMEMLQGETVQQRLAGGPFSTAQLVDAGIALADALEAAHHAGIVHRDIKPANILLTARGPKLLDFGLAKPHSAAGAGLSALETRADQLLTAPGSTVGTVAYMSPEQVRGEELDLRTDLFSLGLVLYEMAAGRPAFAGATGGVLAAAVLHEDPPPPSRARPGLPARLDEIVLKAIEKDRTLRYQHAADLRTDLQRVKRDSESGPAVAGRASSGRGLRLFALAVLFAALAGGLYYSSLGAAKLTDKDTIVVADFVNTTGDPVFDGALRQGLAVQLGQSPFLSLVSDTRIEGAMAMLGRPADARLTPELAREICQRTASAAVLEGSIAGLGSQYVLGLRAKRCGSGDVLVEEQGQAAKKEDVLLVLGQLAKTLRPRLGESLATIQQHDRPLEAVTTPSLDALKAYSGAMDLIRAAGVAEAVPLLKRAVEIDPEFAMAQAQLGLCYNVIGETVLSRESTSKAYELRERTSDREKFFITAMYDRQVTGNLDKADQTFAVWTQTYPRDYLAHGLWSGFTLQGAGRFEHTIEEANKAIDLDPTMAPPYTNVAFAHLYRARVADAERALKRATDVHVDPGEGLIVEFHAALLEGDQAGMDRAVSRAAGRGRTENWMTHLRSLALARSGKLSQAADVSRDAIEGALKTGDRERAAVFEASIAVWQTLFGDGSAGRRHALAALARSDGRDAQYAAAFALALGGDVAKAEALAGDLEMRYPEDTSVRFSYLPTLRGQVALGRGNPPSAVEALKPALPYAHTVPAICFISFFGARYAAYVRGTALLAAHRGADAAAEFRDIITNRGLVLGDPIGAAARVQLGRALALAGDTGNARKTYEEFFELWKEADPGVRLLQDARAEYASLR